MQRLALSLNDDGTITLRCDADAFFAHADEIRRLLSSSASPATAPGRDVAGEEDPEQLRPFWAAVLPDDAPRGSRDLSGPGTTVLVAGYYQTRLRGFEAFTRADVERVLAATPDRRPVPAAALTHLARRGWLERARRGAYALSRRGLDRVESLRALSRRPDRAPARSSAPALPRTSGLSRFLREVPASRKWRRVLLVAYFLHEHCGLEEFDQDVLRAAFRRARGVDAPGALGGLISQVLCKRHGLVERGSRRGSYRLTTRALDELRAQPRVARADALHRAQPAAPDASPLAS